MTDPDIISVGEFIKRASITKKTLLVYRVEEDKVCCRLKKKQFTNFLSCCRTDSSSLPFFSGAVLSVPRQNRP